MGYERTKALVRGLVLGLLVLAESAPAQQLDTRTLADALLACTSVDARADLLNLHAPLVNVALLGELRRRAQVSQDLKRLDEALVSYEVAVQVAERLDVPGYADSVRAVGAIMFMQKRFADAAERFKDGLTVLKNRKTSDPQGTARLLAATGSAYRVLGESRLALQYFEEALQVPNRQPEPSWDAAILMRIGAAYTGLGVAEKALLALRRARALYGSADDLKGLASTAREIGRLQSSQGNNQEARASLLQAVEYAQKSGDAFEKAASNMSLGQLLRNLGDRSGAIKWLEQALISLKQVDDPVLTASALLDVGDVYLTQNDVRQAERYALLAQQVLEKTHVYGSITMRMLELLGKVLSHKNEEKAAIRYFEQALSEARRLQDRFSEGRLLGHIAACYHGLADLSTAIEYDEQSLAIHRDLGNEADICVNLLSLGLYFQGQQMYDRALSLQHEALKFAQATGSLFLVHSSHSAIAETYDEMGKSEEAIEAYKRACEAVPFIIGGIAGGPRSQQLGMEPFARDYTNLIALFARNGLAVEALQYAEEAKARTLVSLLQAGQIDFTKGLTPGERQQFARLEGVVGALGRAALTEREGDRSVQARRTLESARLELEDLENRLYVSHPELVCPTVFHPTSPRDALALVPPKGRIVEFVTCSRGVAAIVLSNDRSTSPITVLWVDIDKDDLAKLVNRFRTDIGQHRLDFRASGSKLYDLLIRPLRDALPASGPLLLIPDGVLWDLPFQALVQPNGHFLIESYDIAYAPSITALQAMGRVPTGRADPRSTLFAVGNPSLGVKGSKVATRTVRGVALQSLPEAESEVRTLATLYGTANSAVQIGSAATETSVKKEIIGYRILHFATHGILDNLTPFYSCLVLAPSGEKDDGLLQAREVAHMRLKADLAVLAGCETARGRISAGEGNVGLSWSFLAAGCPTTVVSQWKVDSKFTSALMLGFHKELSGAGVTPGRALRNAALRLMSSSKYRHPFYWASFVVMGANKPLTSGQLAKNR